MPEIAIQCTLILETTETLEDLKKSNALQKILRDYGIGYQYNYFQRGGVFHPTLFIQDKNAK